MAAGAAHIAMAGGTAAAHIEVGGGERWFWYQNPTK